MVFVVKAVAEASQKLKVKTFDLTLYLFEKTDDFAHMGENLTIFG